MGERSLAFRQLDHDVDRLGRRPVISRGEVCWAALPAPRGSEPECRRPVLVVQSDEFNRSAIGTVLAVTITSTLAVDAGLRLVPGL